MKLPIHLALLQSVSKQSPNAAYNHVAIVMQGGAIKSVACNKGHYHAEQRALDQLWPSERGGTKVISLRFTHGKRVLAFAKPCKECEAYMRGAGVKKVVFSGRDGQLHRMKLK